MKLSLKCKVEYFNDFLTTKESIALFTQLSADYELTTAKVTSSDNDNYPVDFGKIMFIDEDLYEANKFPEGIWGYTAIWPASLIPVKEKIEKLTANTFQVGVCIYYQDGHSGVDYHSDFSAFGDTSLIPSLSLGEERDFYLREKSTLKEHKIFLENGSLIIMGKHCQERYEHALPLDPKYKNPRINLTFRKYGF